MLDNTMWVLYTPDPNDVQVYFSAWWNVASSNDDESLGEFVLLQSALNSVERFRLLDLTFGFDL